MSLWSRLWPWGRKNSTLDLFREIYGSNLAKSGVTVNWETAIKVSTVLACARVIANGIAQVPLKLYQSKPDGGKDVARDHPLYWLLHNQPNQWETSFEYRETLALHLVLAGRHYSLITRGVGGRIVDLLPFEPGTIEAKRARDGSFSYRYTPRDGSIEPMDLAEDEVWHVPGISWNGWSGLDPMWLTREAIGLSISAEQQHAKLFKNGVQTSGTYSVEGTLNKDQHKTLRELLIANYSGDNQGLPMVVDRGAKWLAATMTGVDAQHLEVRRFQVEEVCRSLGVLPIMIGHADKTQTYASSEQQFQAHVTHTLMPWYERIEQRINAYLIGRRDVELGLYAKFVALGLLRGVAKDRAEYFAKALGSGGAPAWMTQDEVRAAEELDPMGGSAAELPKPTNVAPPPAAPDADEQAKRSSELHAATVLALKRDPAPPAINVAAPSITIAPAQVKAGDVHVTLPEGAVQVNTTVEPAQIKAGDVHVQGSEHHINVQHPKSSSTVFKRDPTTLELTRSDTTFED